MQRTMVQQRLFRTSASVPGVNVAVVALGAGVTMAALHTAMQNGLYSREASKVSGVTMINVGPEVGIWSFYRDPPQSRFWSMWFARSEVISDTQRLRFMSKQRWLSHFRVAHGLVRGRGGHQQAQYGLVCRSRLHGCLEGVIK